jgi:uncharacterized iron-regulated membrane protein
MNLTGRHPHRGLRRVAFLVHLALGLGTGLWLVLVSLTGSLIVFRAEMEAALHPALTRVPAGPGRAPLQPMLDGARTAFPGATFHTVNLPTEPGGTVSFWGHDAAGRSFHAYANPHTGEPLGSDLADDNLTEWLYLFHAQLLAGGLGEQINGLGAILWVAVIVTGLILWWPRTGRTWLDGMRVRWSAGGPRRNYDLHRAVGFWAALPLLLVVVTGAYFPFKAPFRWLAETVTGTAATEDSPARLPTLPATPNVSLDTVLTIASAVLPEVPANWIHLPADGSDVFSVRKRLPGEWRLEGANYVHVDPASGTLLRTDLQAARSPAQRLLGAMFPLHVGTFAGPLSRILWAVLGLVPALLFGTGFLLWRRRTRDVRGPAAVGDNPQPTPTQT